MRRTHRPTISDVAERAGVSTFTVSRVINQTGRISAETRAHVERIVAELGYVPSSVARSLRTGRASSCAMIVVDATNPYHAGLIAGAEERFSEEGIVLILSSSGGLPVEEQRHLQMVLSQGVSGLLATPEGSDGSFLAEVESRAPPCVLVDRPGGENMDAVRRDFGGAMELLVQHLAELGHTRFALVSGPKEHGNSRERAEAFARVLESTGLLFADELVRWGPIGSAHGKRAAADILAMPDPPTAIICAGNVHVPGVMEALAESDMRVPQDVSVACFGVIPQLHSSLTGIISPTRAMGRRAAEMLLERMSGYDGPPREETFQLELRVGRSTGPPPARL